ncbi:MAG: isoprenylcysteine carboxylmethyltransferase family protein [Lachnospiraceae bacterium]|nr:isoprenylcysteine carboxylmethyltransferase family protein [Lachnospiraceae bacterium]
MFYQIVAILILITFYAFYFAKLIILKKQSIRVNNMGFGDKSKKVLRIERLTSIATVTVCVGGVFSIFLVKEYIPNGFRYAGIIIGFVAIIFFAMATITMKSSWRVGIPAEKTTLITEGIYKWSRNPAFVGFDFMYISICLMYFNVPLLIFSIFAMLMLHLQILQEEGHMQKMFGEEYVEYKKHTLRYFGRR